MSTRPAWSGRRLPFAGLFTAAVCGIMAGLLVPAGGIVFAAGSLGVLLVWLVLRRTVWVLLAVGLAFGAVQIWQNRESASARLATELGDRMVLVSVEGIVVEEPVAFGGERWRFPLRIEALSGATAGRALLAVHSKGPPPARGDRIRATGSLRRIPPPRNPGQFDVRSWMEMQGMTCQLEVGSPADLVLLAAASPFSLPAIAGRCRAWMEKTLRAGISDDPVAGDLIAGMVLGATASIPDALQVEFRNTGTFHLFSVSGLHVGMIGTILWLVLSTAGVGRRTAVAIIVPALFFYVLITGWKPASIRSAEMSAIFLVGMCAARQPQAFNSLCAAGLFIISAWTDDLLSPGFQFSFLVVAAILLLARPIADILGGYLRPDPFVPRRLWSRWQKLGDISSGQGTAMVGVSVAAWVGSLPLTAGYFHMVSVSAIPANLAVIPLAFAIMVTAVLALVGGVVCTTLAEIYNNANLIFTHALLAVVHGAAQLPASHFLIGSPDRAPAAVTVFDFGAGGAVGIEAGGRLWLLDCGTSKQAENVLVPWMRGRGKAWPDGLLLTHGDARHIGGAPVLLAASGNKCLLVESPADDRSPNRGALHRTLAESGFPKSIRRSGDRLEIAPGIRLAILYPSAGVDREDADDKAVVVRLDAEGWRILFASDAGPHTQRWLLEHCPEEIRADILVKGNHRSGLPMDLAFVAAVGPKAVVATAATFPPSERIDPRWLKAVRQADITAFRMDETGAVRIALFPNRMEMTGFLAGRFSWPPQTEKGPKNKKPDDLSAFALPPQK